MTTQIIGPRIESTTAMLPNRHDIKWTPTSLLYSKINASLSPSFYGSFYLRWMSIHKMTNNWSRRLKNYIRLTRKWDIHSSPLPLWFGSEITVERWWERMRARGFRWLKGNSVSRTQQHSCTNEVTGNVKAYSSPALSQAKQIPAWTRQLGMKSHPSQGAIDKFFASGRVRVIVL